MKKYDLLILTGLFSNMFYSISYPIIHTICIQNITSNFMSLTQLISCILAILVSQLWIKYSDKLYKLFGIFLIFECILFGILLISFLLNIINPKTYYIVDCILSSTITRNIINGGCRLRAIRYKGKERELYDHKNTIICNIASIGGFAFSSIFILSTKLAFILMFLGISIDNIFYYIVYKHTNKTYVDKN